MNFAKLLIVLAGSGLLMDAAQSQDMKALHDRMKRGVVLIQAKGVGRGEKTGTGFLVHKNGIILTSRHVIEESHSVFATFPSPTAQPIRCSLIDDSRKYDLAALKLDRVPESIPIFDLTAAGRPATLDEVLIIGHPKKLNWTVHRGSVSAVRDMADVTGNEQDRGVDVIQLDVSAASGMSGAPALLSNGRITGVFFAGLDQGRASLNFCVHAKHTAALDLTRTPRALGNGPSLSASFRRSGIDYLAQRTIQAAVGGGDVFVPNSQHWGSVAADADYIFQHFVEDQERFDRFIRRSHVEQLLQTQNVIHVTNPQFGYSVLVPSNYGITESVTPSGMFVSSIRGPGADGAVNITAFPIPNPPQNPDEQEIALSTLAAQFVTERLQAFRIGMIDPNDPTAVELGPYSEALPVLNRETGSMRFWRHYANHPRYNRSIVVLFAVYRDVFYAVDLSFPTNLPLAPVLPPRFVEDMFIAHTFSFIGS